MVNCKAQTFYNKERKIKSAKILGELHFRCFSHKIIPF